MTETSIQPAAPQIIALAKVMRPDWDHDVLGAALLAAKNAGWTWIRTFNETARLLVDADGSPWDLRRAAASPTERSVPEPGTEKRGAQLARELLKAKRNPDAVA